MRQLRFKASLRDLTKYFNKYVPTHIRVVASHLKESKVNKVLPALSLPTSGDPYGLLGLVEPEEVKMIKALTPINDK